MPTISQLGYCKYIMPEGGPTGNWTEPQDVILGRCVNFSFNYSWQGDICTISTIRWKPGRIEYNETTGKRTFIREGLESNGFQSANSENNNNSVLIIKFGETSISLAANEHRSIYVNRIYQPDSDDDISITTTNKFLLANFIYDYTGTSGVRYLVEIKNIKIPRFSKYENNVIFNKDGLNEMIDHFQKYPVIEVKSTLTDNNATNGKFGHIKVTRGADPNNPTEEAIRGFGYSTTENLICGKSFLPYSSGNYDLGIDYLEITTDSQYIKGKTYYSAPNSNASIGTISSLADFQNALAQYNTLYTRHRWKNLYLSDNIGSESSRIGNIYATNGEFSESIKGKYEGLPNGLTGDSININDKFKVDDQGNVTMQGNITWADNQFAYIYHKGKNNNPKSQPPAPSGTIEIDDVAESDSLKRWHKTQNSHGDDYWISITYDNGAHWTTPARYRGIDGEPGEQGYWTNENILEALKEPNVARGLYWFPGEQDEQTHEIVDKLALKADVVLAALGCFNKIEMDPGNSYDGTQYSFNGGYISFSVPSPIRYSPANKGWRARLGYLQGNGDGTNPTGGIGFAIHTAAVWNDFNSATTCSDGTSSNTKHLLLSCLMLTQSGLGLMVSKNIGATNQTAENWCKRDNITISNNTGHYTYRWWSGSNQASNITRYYRLWLDENNGMLYWYSGQDKQLKCWLDPTDDAP